MGFEFAAPGRVVFGRGAVSEAGSLAARLGSRAFVVSGRSTERAMPLLDRLELARLTHVPASVRPEPDLESLQDLLEQARLFGPDLLIGFGGGSALDTAKALAALLANGGEPLDYLEILGAGRPLEQPSLPLIAIPTTAGTGSEATRNAVFSAPAEGGRLKVSLRSPTMLPSLALVDPDLTLGLPPRETADCGLDALTQLIEPLTSARASPLVDGLCREGLRRGFPALTRAYAEGGDPEARSEMAFASLAGGLALANAGLGAVHGLAGPVGGLSLAPHGAVCAALLPHVVAANVEALREGRPCAAPGGAPELLSRYAEIAALAETAGGAKARGPRPPAEEAGPALRAYCAGLGVRPLRDLGLDPKDFGALAETALNSSSMRANPVSLDRRSLVGILEAAW